MAENNCGVRITSMEIGNVCPLSSITGIGVFPNGIDGNLSIVSLADIAYLNGLTMLDENAKNKLIILQKGKFLQDEKTPGENKFKEFAYGSQVLVSQTYGGNKFTLANTLSARNTLDKINGIAIPCIYFHQNNYVTGVDSGSVLTIKPFTAMLALIDGFDEVDVLYLDVKYQNENYELKKVGTKLSYEWTDIITPESINFESTASGVASISFIVYGADRVSKTDSDLTVGANGVHKFAVTKDNVTIAGAVTYDSSTELFTFTPTVAFTIGDVIKGGYQDPSISGEAWITNIYETKTIA